MRASSGTKLAFPLPCGSTDGGGEAQTTVNVAVRGVGNVRWVRGVAGVPWWVTVEGTQWWAKGDMLFVLVVGQSSCLRGESRQSVGTGQTRKGETLLRHGRHGGAVIRKRQVLLSLNVRLQRDEWLPVKGRAPARRTGPGSTGEGIPMLSDARVTWTTVVYVIRWAGQWKTCLREKGLSF